MTNILITGATGFVGSHMVDYILLNHPKCKIYATKRWMEDTKNLDHIYDDKFEYINCDLIDGFSIKRAVEISKPEKGINIHFVSKDKLLKLIKQKKFNTAAHIAMFLHFHLRRNNQ